MDDAAQPVSLRLILLGPVAVFFGDRPVTGFRSRKALALLLYLAVTGGVQPREHLAGLLWPELPEDYARASLSQALTNLRQLVGALVVTTRSSVALEATRLRLDTTDFSAALTPLLTAGAAQRAPDELATALAAYRGDFLTGLSLADAPAFEEWATARREHYRHLAVLGLHALADHQARQRAFPAAAETLQRLVALEPWREEAHCQLMEVLAASGQRSAALAQYEQCRRLLASELAAAPSPETTALYERLKSETTPRPTQPAAAIDLDWADAPDPGRFYGRQREVAMLERWLLQDQCRVIAIVGLGGVGKTALAATLARALVGQFDGVIWRSVLNAPPLAEVLREWFQTVARRGAGNDHAPTATPPATLDGQLDTLIADLRQQRWLLVLDNLESILGSGETAAAYRPGYTDYGQLLDQLGRRPHGGCLLITSRERPPELGQLVAAGLPVQIMELTGLAEEAGRDILHERALSGSPVEELALVDRYSGNPLALRLVAQTVGELYAGDIAAFLSAGTPIFDDIRAVLDQQVARLSPLELEVLTWLAIEREPLALPTLANDLVQPVPQAALLEAVRSLRRRSLIEPGGSALALQNVVTEYLTDRLVGAVVEELVTGRPDLLHRHALLKAEAKEYVRQSQVRLILEPVAMRSATRLGSDGLAVMARRLLGEQRRQPERPSYVAGNLLNLLLHLGSDLRGLDLSRLRVWQAYLRGLTLPAINLTGADLQGSAFSDDFRAITTLCFSPDGRQIAAGTNDGVVRCWRTTDWQPVHSGVGHSRSIRSVAYSPDGSLLASAGSDGTVRLWEATTGRLYRLLEGRRGQAMSVVFVADGALLACAYWEEAIILWEVATGQPRHILEGPIDIIESVAISPDGRLLASGGWDGKIRLWDWASAQLVHEWRAHEQVIKMVAFSPDGQTLGSGSWDTTAGLWEVATGRLLRRLIGHGQGLASLAFSSDGALVAVGGSTSLVRVWETRTGQPMHVLQGHTSWVEAITFAPHASMVASGGWDQSIRLWDQQTGRALQTLHGFSSRVTAVAYSPDGALLASAHHDRMVRLWEAASGRPLATLAGNEDAVHSVAFSPDGRLIASGGHDQTMRLWEVASGRALAVLRGHADAVNEVIFTPDGALLIGASHDRTVSVWAVALGQRQWILSGHAGHVERVAVSPDGQWVVSGGNDPKINVWEVATGRLARQLEGDTRWTGTLRFAPDGQLLVSGGHDRMVRLYQPATGALVGTLPTPGSVYSLAFSPDSRRLAAGDNVKLITVWEVATGQPLLRLEGHTDAVVSLSFSPDGAVLASCSHDETIRLWDAVTGECRRVMRVARPYAGMIISGITGITEAQRAALIALGAIETSDLAGSTTTRPVPDGHRSLDRPLRTGVRPPRGIPSAARPRPSRRPHD